MRTIFIEEQVAFLKRHPSVFSCTARSINYTYEFKREALKLHASGVTAREIWERAGFDATWWKKRYFQTTLRDWRRIVNKKGDRGLRTPGGVQYDHGPTHIPQDKLRRLELEVSYLKKENSFLAKRRAGLGLFSSLPKRSTD